MKILITSSEKVTGSQDLYYFGKEAFEKYGETVYEALQGKAISKRIDKAEEPGGLIYEADLLGMDKFDLLETLEGLCYNDMAYEKDDSTYLVGRRVTKIWRSYEG